MLHEVDDRILKAKDFIDERNTEHMDYIKDVKRTNMARVFGFMQEHNLQNLFNGWKKVINHWKLLKVK
jgi:hypothetical protein